MLDALPYPCYHQVVLVGLRSYWHVKFPIVNIVDGVNIVIVPIVDIVDSVNIVNIPIGCLVQRPPPTL